MKLTAVTLDCADPLALADFYHRATGLPVHERSDAEFAGLARGPAGAGLFLGFQRVEGYRPPSWPGRDVPQQPHLDFDVDDLDEAAARLVAPGRVSKVPPARRRPARTLAALSGSPRYIQHRGDPPPCDRTHRTPPGLPFGQTTLLSTHALGATVPADQPRPDLWRVVLDPAGHPFCLTVPRTA
nr:VOC family protein [Streptomyces sp. CS081A]